MGGQSPQTTEDEAFHHGPSTAAGIPLGRKAKGTLTLNVFSSELRKTGPRILQATQFQLFRD